MGEKNYRICLTAPLGARYGSLVLHEADGKVDGWLHVMNKENRCSGVLSAEGQLTLTGTLRTLVSTMQPMRSPKTAVRSHSSPSPIRSTIRVQ